MNQWQAHSLWERIGNISSTMPGPGGGTGGNGAAEATQCSLCNQRELHCLFNLPGTRMVCPLQDLTDKTKTRYGAKWICDQKRANPSKDIQELLNCGGENHVSKMSKHCGANPKNKEQSQDKAIGTCGTYSTDMKIGCTFYVTSQCLYVISYFNVHIFYRAGNHTRWHHR
jgi:hypothetical protein